MATNKNQHFVPRCHLRPFTLEGQDASITLFNIERKKLINKAPVKNQCSKDYFYGTDENLEQAIQLVESGYGRALRSILNDSRTLKDEDKAVFKTFWIFQHMRTEAAAMRAVEFAESTRTLADIPPGEFSLDIKGAVQMACQTFGSVIHQIDDLKCCIIKNKTDVPFITSDNPAILTNKWRLDQDKSTGFSFGMGSAGTIAILPLSPKLLFLAYDGDVYNIPNIKGVLEIKNSRDAIALNRHQFLQCFSNIYVHDAKHEKALTQHYSEIESRRPKNRHVIHYAEIDSTNGSHVRYKVIPAEDRDKTKDAMMHSQVIHPHPGIWPSQISIRKNGSVFTNDTGVGYIRYAQTFMESRYPFRREHP